ncbi:MAG: hypothetical protein CME64_11620 [Halobacteriovoraceae bacterium]|nr:hypothetical protein [Halobacteriovoraceae bacterium]|tara:strand:- start:72863 stop:73945 length:1083 start_codon:yes stop_codon:yes gene_type:complete
MNKNLLFFISLLLLSVSVHAKFEYHPDWSVHKTCGQDSREKQEYCLELIEFENKNDDAKLVLLVSGFFQNAYIWDLLPNKEVSVARYLVEKWNLRPYVLHVRGIGNSDYVAGTNMDDIAMDDIEMAVDWLKEKSKDKIYIMGHSQGSITTQAYLAGLSKCIVANCFNPAKAWSRQRKVKAVALLAGNTAMSVDRVDNKLDELAKMALFIRPAFRFFDEIDVKTLTRFTGPVSNLNLWQWLYNRHNTSKEARKALYTKTVDSTTNGILFQFAEGVRDRAIKTRTKLPYPSALPLIRIPVFQQLYADDPLAEAEATLKDNFHRIGSSNKEYEILQDRGHEDFFMNKNLHSDLDNVVEFLLAN